ncbi:MAG: hypothetical protein ABFD50_18295 [Smithella sp.]
MFTYILRNLNVLNGILLAAIALLVVFIAIPFFSMDIWLTIPKIPPAKIGQSVQTTVTENPPFADYALISDQNLFNPARRIPPAGAEEKIFARPEIILYGTLITGKMRIAFIEDKKTPKTTPGRGKRQIAVQKGYNINGYVLKQIDPDKIVFVKGMDRIVVRLEEGEKRKETKEQITNPQEAAPKAPSESPSPMQVPPSIQEQPPKATGR